jgi:hypothetical protein
LPVKQKLEALLMLGLRLLLAESSWLLVEEFAIDVNDADEVDEDDGELEEADDELMLDWELD